jgi:hypothetical protein
MSQEHNNHDNNDYNNYNNNINHINHHGGGDDGIREEYPAPNLEDLAMASVLLPLARANLLDYLYASGLPLRPIQLGGAGVGGVAGGGGGGGGADMDIDGIAAILANSLYDLRPVKTVVDEKGMADISEKTFTAQLAEELKINTVCGIWQDEFEEGELIKILPCNHAFKAEAIERWLTTEKAECPICRFSLSSKEVIYHPLSSDVANDDDVDGGGEAMIVDAPDDDHIQQNIPQINENHIAARLADNIHNRSHREDPVRAVYAGAYASRQSISMPINQLIQSRRNMIDNIARASGGARMASRWPAAAAAAPVAAAAEPAAHPQHINNYYIGNIGNIINAEPVNPVEDYNNRYNNRYNNDYYNNDNDNNNYNNDNISNRERDDIQEAIRRSLEEQ